MERNRKQKFGASVFVAGALTIAGGFLLDDPVGATPAGSSQTSGTTPTTEATTTTPTTESTTTTQGLGVGAGGATNPGQAPAPEPSAALPRTGPGGIDPGILLVLGGGLAVSGVLIVRYAADKP